MRIVFVTPEEPSVMPMFFDRVLGPLREDVAAVAVVSPIYKKSSWTGQAKRFVGSFGAREFAREAAHYGYHRAADLLSRARLAGTAHSVRGVARARGIPLLAPEDVNSPEFLHALGELRPDLVISVSCPQIFGTELLTLPRLGCVNVHSALLPDYRGMLPTFWVLAAGERETGVTVHEMTPGIDAGDILVQRRVAIAPDDSLHSLMRKCKVAAAGAVIETVEQFRAGTVRRTPNPAGEGSYFSFPTRAAVLRFRSLGRSVR